MPKTVKEGVENTGKAVTELEKKALKIFMKSEGEKPATTGSTDVNVTTDLTAKEAATRAGITPQRANELNKRATAGFEATTKPTYEANAKPTQQQAARPSSPRLGGGSSGSDSSEDKR